MAGERTRHVLVRGLNVTDEALYRRYREGMRPILERFGGAFGYDFEVSRVLASESGQPINRVFTLWFPDRERAEAFFADPEYLAVRRECFEPAVNAITKIATFGEPASAASSDG
jgi:uncharacterized protein (DUF1330 family)